MNKLVIAALLLATIPVSDWLAAKFPPPVADEMGYSEAARREMATLIDRVTPAREVVLMKDGFMIYDSGERAEMIAELWNIGDPAEAEAVLALLDRKRFLENKR